MSRLAESAEVTLDAAGQGVVRLGPVPAWQTWQVAGVAVECSPADPHPVAELFDGPVGPSNSLGSTGSGGRDNYAADLELLENQSLHVQWTGGPVGAVARARLIGTAEGAN